MKPMWDGSTPFQNFFIQLNGYFVEKGIDLKDDAKTLPLIPLCLSGDALSFVASWEDDGRRTFRSAMDSLKKWYLERGKPKEPLLSFANRKWQMGESLDSFVGDLKQLVEYISSAKDTKKELLCAQFLSGIPPTSAPLLKAYIISDRPSFEQLVDYTRALDISPQAISPSLAVCSELSSHTINAIGIPKSFSSSSTCYRCGQKGHIASSCRLPKDIICNNCKKVGHIGRACRSSHSSQNQGKDRRW
jgi:hypothetical protein